MTNESSEQVFSYYSQVKVDHLLTRFNLVSFFFNRSQKHTAVNNISLYLLLCLLEYQREQYRERKITIFIYHLLLLLWYAHASAKDKRKRKIIRKCIKNRSGSLS